MIFEIIEKHVGPIIGDVREGDTIRIHVFSHTDRDRLESLGLTTAIQRLVNRPWDIERGDLYSEVNGHYVLNGIEGPLFQPGKTYYGNSRIIVVTELVAQNPLIEYLFGLRYKWYHQGKSDSHTSFESKLLALLS